MKGTTNITNGQELEESGLVAEDPVHLGVCGPGYSTNDYQFVGRLMNGNLVTGVRLSIRGKAEDFPWGDLIELWPIPPPVALSGPQKGGLLERFCSRLFGE